MHTNQPTTRAMERSDYENATNLYLYETGLNDELRKGFKKIVKKYGHFCNDSPSVRPSSFYYQFDNPL